MANIQTRLVYDEETTEILDRIDEIEDCYIAICRKKAINNVLDINFHSDDLGMIKLSAIRDRLLRKSIPTHFVVNVNGHEEHFPIA